MFLGYAQVSQSVKGPKLTKAETLISNANRRSPADGEGGLKWIIALLTLNSTPVHARLPALGHKPSSLRMWTCQMPSFHLKPQAAFAICEF